MPTITWNKYNRCLIAQGFTDDQKIILGELIPFGFVDKLMAAGLDPRTFRLSVGEKKERKSGDQRQIPIFKGNQI